MKLLRVSNLAAPFTKRTHLATLFGIIVAFVVFQVSGGGFSASTPEEKPRRPAAEGYDLPRTASRTRPAASDAPTEQEYDSQNLVGDILETVPRRRADRAATPTPKGINLEEIEKQVGLR